ncbi:MAG: type II toxin-antitoxin system VapC family toxin [Candidatus Helarchaeota archaeon]
MKLFIDSGPFIARINEKDPNHKLILSVLNDIKNRKLEFTRIFTSNYIIDESVTHVLYDTRRHDMAVKVLDLIETSKIIETLWVTPEIEEKAKNIFRKFPDQMFSFTDCTSFTLMKENKITNALTFDSHFKTMKFNVIP